MGLALCASVISHAEAGQTLGAAAAVIGAASPMVTAGISAGADVAINGMNAEVAMYTNDRLIETNEKIAAMSSQTSLALAGLQASVALSNNQGVTNRLAMQLAELRASSQLTRQMDREALLSQSRLYDRQLALEEKTLASQTALTQASMGLGYGASLDSGASLAVTSYGIARPTAKAPSERLLNSLATPATTTTIAPTSSLRRVKASRALKVAKNLVRIASSNLPSRSLGTVPRAAAAAAALLNRHGARAAASAPAEAGHSHGGHGHGDGVAAEPSTVVKLAR